MLRPDSLYLHFLWAGGLQMGKHYLEDDYAFLMNKFDFDEELNYLPHTFSQEAEEVCSQLALSFSEKSAKDTFKSLVEHFIATS